MRSVSGRSQDAWIKPGLQAGPSRISMFDASSPEPATPEPSIKLSLFGMRYQEKVLEKLEPCNISCHSTAASGSMSPVPIIDDDHESTQLFLREASQIHPWVERIGTKKRQSEWFEEGKLQRLAATLTERQDGGVKIPRT